MPQGLFSLNLSVRACVSSHNIQYNVVLWKSVCIVTIAFYNQKHDVIVYF